MSELRTYHAEYYDTFTEGGDDICFYKDFISSDITVLEFGCGTGRVTYPLAREAKKIIGVDISKDMISRAKEKQSSGNIDFILGNMVSLDLNTRFDLIIAPFRVLQVLETEKEVVDFLKNIKNHISPEGLAILNIFNPNKSRKDMETKWMEYDEIDRGETHLENGDLLKYSELKKRLDSVNQIFYVDLIYRRYRNSRLIDEHINPICMRYYYPDEFKYLISQNGFILRDFWGGYKGENYGEGSELVLSFGCD